MSGPGPARPPAPDPVPRPDTGAHPLADHRARVETARTQPALRETARIEPSPAPVTLAGPVALASPDPGISTTSRRLAPVGDEREREHLRPHAERLADTGGTPAGAPDRSSGTGPIDPPLAARSTCTSAQLRRFIKSRPWVPMHELRRRFGINGNDDDVTPIQVAGQRLYVGLPIAEGRLVAELLAGGDVGYELSMDPTVPIVVGVYPMRPVPRG